MGLAHDYVSDVWKQRSVNALYPPSGTVRLGDMLQYKNGAYKARTTLAALKFDPKVLEAVDERQGRIKRWSVKSSDGVDVHAKLKGKLPGGVTLNVLSQTSVGAVVTMKNSNSFLLAMSDITTTAWANPEALNEVIRHLFWRNRWDTSWIVVTEIWEPRHCTFLASSKANAQFEMEAKTGVKVSAADVDVSAGLSIVDTSSDQDSFTDSDGTVPIFRGHRWLLGMRPAGKKGVLFDIANDATTESLGADPNSVFADVVPVRFDPDHV